MMGSSPPDLHPRLQVSGDLGPDSTHIPGYVSKRFLLVGLLCFKTQACLLNVDGRVSPVGKKVGRGRRFGEGLWACAIGAWSVERAEMNFRQIFTRDMFVLSWLRSNKATGRSSGNEEITLPLIRLFCTPLLCHAAPPPCSFGRRTHQSRASLFSHPHPSSCSV